MPEDRLPYDHDKFVDRDAEVRLVIDKTRHLADGRPEEKRVVIFRGARGAGKSWLLHEIKYQLHEDSRPVLTMYVGLEGFSHLPVDESVRQVLRQIDDGVRTWTGFSSLSPVSDLAEQAKALGDNVRRLNRALVVLFDHVDESSRDLLERLEEYCLSPLAVELSVLTVLAGRGKAYIWKRPEFRLKSEEYDLLPFDPLWTLEQLRKQDPQAAHYADEIYELSVGVPWSNYLLRTLPASKGDALQHTKENLLGSETRFLVQPYLEALSVLRAFDENRMSVMFGAYFQQPATNWTYAQCRDIRSQLTELRLACWDRGKGEFTLDRAIRQIVEESLFENNPDMWIALHRAAYRLYGDWASRYARTAAQYQAEANYHAQCLQIKGSSVSNC